MSQPMTWPKTEPRVVDVAPLPGFRLRLRFNDGSSGEVDLKGWVVGTRGVFEPLDDPEYFARVQLSTSGGSIEWPNGADLCPDVLYSRATGQPLPEPPPTPNDLDLLPAYILAVRSALIDGGLTPGAASDLIEGFLEVVEDSFRQNFPADLCVHRIKFADWKRTGKIAPDTGVRTVP